MKFIVIFGVTENIADNFTEWGYTNKILADIDKKDDDDYEITIYTSSLWKITFKDNKVMIFSEEYEEFTFNEGEFEEVEIG